MKTKVILHGGYANHENAQNNAFFKEILKGTPKKPSILLVLFAKEKKVWPQKQAALESQFLKSSASKTLRFVVATEESFEQEIKNADIVYFHGGDTEKLLKIIQNHTPLAKLVSGKTVVGESAGTYLLSTCFYSKTLGEVRKGVGLVPAKSICYYVGKNEEKLEACPHNLEKVLLKDYEYKVFNPKP